MGELFLANLLLCTLPLAAQLPPDLEKENLVPTKLLIKDCEDCVLRVPSNSKLAVEIIKTKAGRQFRISFDDMSLDATQLQLKAQKEDDSILITGMKDPVFTIKPTTPIRYESVKTSNGPRIRFTINENIKFETTRAEIELGTEATTRITTLKIKDTGVIEFDTNILPRHDPKPKQP
jgi:hypothetical protein